MAAQPTAADANGGTPSPVNAQPPRSSASRTTAISNLFTLPAPLRQLFDAFPRRTYPLNPLPIRTTNILAPTEEKTEPQDANGTSSASKPYNLLLWTAGEGCRNEWVASFNPTCLTWQVFLLLRKVSFHIVPANNHAASSGTLPLLLPSSSPHHDDGPLRGQDVVGLPDLDKWASQQLAKEQVEGEDNQEKVRQRVWRSLLEGPIRRAWLYHMYLTANHDFITVPCYIHNQTSQSLVRVFLAHELRVAAQEELLKHAPKINEEQVYQEGKDALLAFEGMLRSYHETSNQSPAGQGNDNSRGRGIFGKNEPGLLDAMLFAFTYLLFGLETRCWPHSGFLDVLGDCTELKRHRKWMLTECLDGKLRLPNRWLEIAELAPP